MINYISNFYTKIFGNNFEKNKINYEEKMNKYANLYLLNKEFIKTTDLKKKAELFNVNCDFKSSHKYLNVKKCYDQINYIYNEKQKENILYIFSYYLNWLTELAMNEEKYHNFYNVPIYDTKDGYITPYKKDNKCYLKIELNVKSKLYLTALKDLNDINTNYVFNNFIFKDYHWKFNLENKKKLIIEKFNEINNNKTKINSLDLTHNGFRSCKSIDGFSVIFEINDE